MLFMTISTPEAPAVVLGPRKLDPREPEVRFAALLDAGSIVPLHPRDTSGVEAVRGRVDGAKVIVYCTDATRQGGAMGWEGCQHIVDAIDTAIRERIPVIGLFHCGGARLAEGAASLDGVGNMFAAMVRASGRVPQISVVLGPSAGGAAYGPALTDVVIMAPEGRLFVTGPDVVKSVTGEDIDMESLGGPGTHGRKSGVVHIVADSEADAFARARRVTLLFSRPGIAGVAGLPNDPDLESLLPKQRQRAYNVKPLIDRLLDEPMEELQARWAPNIVIGLGRLAGRSVGVVANNPLRLGGCLDSTSAEKASRFVRLCDAFGIPLLVIVDVPGYLPGVGQEWEGVVRRGAKLLHAFAEAVVPRVTLVTR
jgi:acetyl-CoA/propionyl-CoA carboxylase carboxyl transferase subunit